MTISQTTPESLEEIVAFNSEIFGPLYTWPVFTLEEYRERLKGKEVYILTAEENGKIVGDSISFEKDGYFYIWILGVSLSFRNQGIATKFFEMNEAYARDKGIKSVRVKVYEVSKEMIDLAERRRYTIIETIEDGTHSTKAFVMELNVYN